jgi:hypothetical protein
MQSYSYLDYIQFRHLMEGALRSGDATVDEIPPQSRMQVLPAQQPQRGYVRVPAKKAHKMGLPPDRDPIPPEQQSQVFPQGEPEKVLPDDHGISYQDFVGRVSQFPGTSIDSAKVRNKEGRKEKVPILKLGDERTLGVPRAEMPQLKVREDFLRWLMNNGIQVSRVMVSPASLWEKNNQWYKAHAQNAMQLPKAYKFVAKNTLLHKSIILTRDGRIFDGNHHWLALMGTVPDKPVPMYQVHLDFEPLKKFTTKHYPDVRFEEHWVSWLNGYAQSMLFEGVDF